jgi:hypothetical protein
VTGVVNVPLHQDRPAPRHRATGHPLFLPVLGVVGAALIAVVLWIVVGAQDESPTIREPTLVVPHGTGDQPAGQGTTVVSFITVSLATTSAEPMQPVPLSGVLEGASPGSELEVQLLDPEAGWVAFPLRPVVDGTGRFSTYVEVGEPGLHEVRVVVPASGVTSSVLELRVR